MFGLTPFVMDTGINNTNSSLSDIFDTFFNDDLINAFSRMEDSIKVQVKEIDDAYLMQAEIPRANKEDIKLNFDNNYLTIKAVISNNYENNLNNCFSQGICKSQVSRSFYFNNVNKENIRAKFENGMLDIILPKKEISKNNSSEIFIQ